MKLYLPLIAFVLCLAVGGGTSAETTQSVTLRQLCNLQASDAPVALNDAPLKVILNVYSTIKLAGPAPCDRVKFFIAEMKSKIQFQKILKRNESRKEFKKYYIIQVFGSAYFDKKLGSVRIDIDRVSRWRELRGGGDTV